MSALAVACGQRPICCLRVVRHQWLSRRARVRRPAMAAALASRRCLRWTRCALPFSSSAAAPPPAAPALDEKYDAAKAVAGASPPPSHADRHRHGLATTERAGGLLRLSTEVVDKRGASREPSCAARQAGACSPVKVHKSALALLAFPPRAVATAFRAQTAPSGQRPPKEMVWVRSDTLKNVLLAVQPGYASLQLVRLLLYRKPPRRVCARGAANCAPSSAHGAPRGWKR